MYQQGAAQDPAQGHTRLPHKTFSQGWDPFLEIRNSTGLKFFTAINIPVMRLLLSAPVGLLWLLEPPALDALLIVWRKPSRQLMAVSLQVLLS